ncbi:hypothetical protein [Actinophytocola oryzae]|uniref:Uncharacterized protein n=1 Tax=Actinophytocola oryzae TaxID=502181 RepID=A0A4R7VHR0_9PSEU|nr:hypothetical protein [Actinophytocola oryzae]TDV48695.1 hypothetical protein CLV71_10855 [Actinophytocola oryzae]
MTRVRTGAAVLLAAGIAHLGAQLWHTVRNRNRWPFCAYNMFSYSLPDRWEQLRVVLYDTRGVSTGPMDPFGLLPVEFFRIVSIVEQVFITSSDTALRTEFCESTVRLLNNGGWRDFDEVRTNARSASGLPVAAFDLYLVEVDAVRCDPFDRASVCGATLLHRHDPREVVRDQEPGWRLVSP